MGDNGSSVLDDRQASDGRYPHAGNAAFASAELRARESARRKVARTITPEAGHALETLGHAIEYLIDEMNLRALQGATRSEFRGTAEAIDLLKAANRTVYFECPVVLPSAWRVGLAWIRCYH